MRRIKVIGIGAGDPDYVTLQAVKALDALDVVFIPDKGAQKTDLKDARLDLCARLIAPGRYRVVTFPMPGRERSPEDYGATVADWHARIAKLQADLLRRELGDDQCGGFLVWGDPSLYDSTLRILAAIRAEGLAFDLEVIPGISAVQALCARHHIPLNAIGEAVLVTTGRKLGTTFPPGAGSVVVMLDGEQAFATFGDAGVEIFWGAYLGTPDELLVAGRLGDVKDEIRERRAAARARKGWIMDIYLLRRCAPRSR